MFFYWGRSRRVVVQRCDIFHTVVVLPFVLVYWRAIISSSSFASEVLSYLTDGHFKDRKCIRCSSTRIFSTFTTLALWLGGIYFRPIGRQRYTVILCFSRLG
ncbi:hypothetical protein BX666DRAFT_57371 [Dichotomocladium elegans]|nr:hypothetical protein BX666DRAFT_57371 [Dichotomocladium elegans]